jgi:transcriptional regulator with XRE-family HTH domain
MKTTDVAEQIGQNIKTFRELRGISPEKMALLCEFSRSYLSRLERGLQIAKIPALCRIADVLDVSLAQLVS